MLGLLDINDYSTLTSIWLQPNLIASFRRELPRNPTLLTVARAKRLWENELLSPFQIPTKLQHEKQARYPGLPRSKVTVQRLPSNRHRPSAALLRRRNGVRLRKIPPSDVGHLTTYVKVVRNAIA